MTREDDAGDLPARSSLWLPSAQARIPLKDRQRQAREDWVPLRVATVVLVLAAAAVLVIVSLIIATHS